MTIPEIVAASFRDPSGFLFVDQGILYRQVNQCCQSDYDRLMESGLYAALQKDGLLIPHSEVDPANAQSELAYKVLRPEPVLYISYPYEWCFSQLKDAALTTLKIQLKALKFGMTLKDASAYNIQFHNGKPILIDTLSFTRYQEGQPWVAYRQFCQHFLAPLALMSYTDVGLNQLLRAHIDGIPLPLTCKLLPTRCRLRFSLLIHLYLHARSQKQHESAAIKDKAPTVRKTGLLGILDSLESAIKSLRWRPAGTEWGEYYSDTNYTDDAMEQKKALVTQLLDQIEPRPTIINDLGANTGIFSRIAGKTGALVISQDIDPAAVEKNYLTCSGEKLTNILPLVLDLTNPSPALGWEHRERLSMLDRGPADVVIALALIHHLAISNNVPFHRIAAFFQKAGKHLLIEFVPKNDSQVQRLLASREDIFPEYTEAAFEAAFEEYFRVEYKLPIRNSERTLYRMSNRKLIDGDGV